MFKSVLIFTIAGLVLSALPSVAAQPINDVEEVVRGMAQSVPDARNSVGRDAQGQAKWAGIWMDEKQVCDQGKLNPAGQRVVQAGQRYARDNGARLTLFTPPESEQVVRRDMAEIAPEATVRRNTMIGRHCYLVISK